MSRADEALRPSSSSKQRALLAALLRDRAHASQAANASARVPLSYGQRTLWMLHQRAPTSPAYNTAFVIRVRSPVDAAALRSSLRSLAERHEALRTTFASEQGRPVALTSSNAEPGFEHVHAGGWADEALHARVAADYRRPFDLRRGPLLRVTLYTRADSDHVLLLALHHIICDAWSMWVLMHELGQLYPAALAGQDAGLPPPRAQFSDFVGWQNELLSGPEGDRLWQYWREALSGELPILQLSTDRPRSAVQNAQGASHPFRIGKRIVEAATELGKAQGATLFVVLLAAFHVVLHRYTGQDDIVVGSPVAGRNNPDMAETVGFLANTVPLRADLSGNPTFREFVSRIRPGVLDALAHQDLPFPLLVERLQPKRHPGRWPVVEAMLVFQRPPKSQKFLELLGGATGGRVRWAGFEVESYPLAQMEGQFDLILEVIEARGDLSCVLKYDPALFEAATARRMAGHFTTLLEAAAADPDRPIGLLPLLTQAERAELLAFSRGPRRDYDLGRCLHHWIEDQVERSPDAPAVMLADAGELFLSYRELNARSNRLARRLMTLGAGPDSVVGVLAERSLELMVALLGVLKAGAAYLPLDPEQPRQRLAAMLADARAPILVASHAALVGDLLGPHVVCLDEDWSAAAEAADTNPGGQAGPDHLAYLIYTSGSTGHPKGVENTQRGICNRLLWMQEAYRLDGSDRVLQKTTIGFDVSVWELFWPLMAGACLVMARPGGHRDRDYLAETIARCRITTAHFVPSMLRVFLEADAAPSCRMVLRRVVCSGEALPPELETRFFDRLGPDVELYNLYGPTEAAVDVTHWRCRPGSDLRTVPIGPPIANTLTYLLDGNLQPVPVGIPGELHIGGVALARGYCGRPELTAEKFIPDPFGNAGCRLYRTGDLCRWLPGGAIEYLHRIDSQAKIRGVRVEPGEVEAVLRAHPQLRDAVVRVDRLAGDARLLAWIVPWEGACPSAAEIRRFLADRLPGSMIPARFVPLGALPLGVSGKLDAAALPPPGPEHSEPATDAPPRTDVERRVAAVWREVLRVPHVGTRDNFFDLGGHSLLVAELQTGLANAFGSAPSIVEMFRHTTVQALASFYSGEAPAQAFAPAAPAVPMSGTSGIAVIGMAGRFPGVEDVDALWRNLCEGVESIARFDEAELRAAGVDPAVLGQPNHVPAFGALAGIEGFDAGFFGMTPREADLTDVQHRLLLECAWSALENAGHDPAAEGGRCGVFAGVGMNRYLLNNLMPNRELMASVDAYQLMLGNDKDFAPTRISYRLGLTGPSVSVQTACSTSLVAVHMACRSLLAGECDVALAGGCSVTLPQDQGYLHQDGMILSPDGHCRAFDAQAGGTVGGSGVGMVLLKRLEAALADGDTVHAVIKGTAINNDGAAKAGYTAPSVEGQAAAITAALSAAGASADSIGLVEAHGTGTPLGDPIEVAALSQAFRASTDRTGYCALGSVKTNLGHLDTAAGVTGLIKATLAVEHGMLPPTLHFQVPNPALDLARSPFFVPTALRPWDGGASPRRAGVSSFGIGGTNAHAVLEQAPVPDQSGPGRPFQLFALSAREAVALDDASARLARYLRRHPGMDPADAAYTLARGRRAFGHRRVVVSGGTDDAAAALAGEGAPGGPFVLSGEARACAVAFMFAGQGSQHAAMAAGLYRDEPVFREQLDRCAALLQPHLGRDIRHVLYPETTGAQYGDLLLQSGLAQPALFAIEYALAQLWMAWGVRPGALIGHSLGEYVAACLAGVWSLEDALAIVAWRAELMHRQAGGGMLAVALAEDEVRALLPPGMALAAVNGPGQCVVSGPLEAVEALSRDLAARGTGCQRLQTSHAFHSPSMDEPARLLAERMRRVVCRAPRIPFVSSLTGTWIEPGQACDPEYWARHMRETVRFSDGLDTMLQDPARCLVEAGPGNALGTLALRHPRRSRAQTVVGSLPRPQDPTPETAHLLQAAGTLWANGVELDWAGFYAGQRRRRLPLPAYPFQRRRHWIDPPRADTVDPAPVQRAGIADWFYVPSWQRTLAPEGGPEPGQHWLLFMDELGVGDALAARLEERGDSVTRVYPGACFARLDAGAFVLHPGARDEYGRLAEALRRSARLPGVVAHLWNVTAPGAGVLDTAEARDRSFHSLVFLARCLAEEAAGSCHILVASTGLFDVTGDEALDPAKALLLGPVVVIPQEHAGLTCGSVDLDLAPRHREDQIRRLLAEAAVRDAASTVAYRGPHRWTQIFTPAPLPPAPPPLRPGGRYLITGGTGGMGLHLAEWLARTAPGARLALVARATGLGGEGRELGAELLTLQADVADREQMRCAIDRVRACFGGIDGVIHAAGVAGGGTIAMKTRAGAEQEFAAKVDGTLILASLLEGEALDFFVLCSSLTSATGGFGQVAYSAANAFEDAFAHAQASSDPPRRFVCIDWDRWQDVGMAATLEARYRDLTGEELKGGMRPAEALEAFGRILAASPAPRIVVCTRDFPDLIRQSRSWQLGRIERQIERQRGGFAQHSRPSLANDFVAPEGETERRIAELWQEELGIDRIGAHDDFFALGGDSLIAIKLVSRLRRALDVPLKQHAVYESSTIAKLAEHVAALRCTAPEEDFEEGVI